MADAPSAFAPDGDMSDAGEKRLDKQAEDAPAPPPAASSAVSIAALSASLMQAQAAIQAMMSSTAGATGLLPDSTKQPAIHNPVQFSQALDMLEHAVSIAHALKATEDVAHASHGTAGVAGNDGEQPACLVRTPRCEHRPFCARAA
jgi:hypothetical protein